MEHTSCHYQNMLYVLLSQLLNFHSGALGPMIQSKSSTAAELALEAPPQITTKTIFQCICVAIVELTLQRTCTETNESTFMSTHPATTDLALYSRHSIWAMHTITTRPHYRTGVTLLLTFQSETHAPRILSLCYRTPMPQLLIFLFRTHVLPLMRLWSECVCHSSCVCTWRFLSDTTDPLTLEQTCHNY